MPKFNPKPPEKMSRSWYLASTKELNTPTRTVSQLQGVRYWSGKILKKFDDVYLGSVSTEVIWPGPTLVADAEPTFHQPNYYRKYKTKGGLAREADSNTLSWGIHCFRRWTDFEKVLGTSWRQAFGQPKPKPVSLDVQFLYGMFGEGATRVLGLVDIVGKTVVHEYGFRTTACTIQSLVTNFKPVIKGLEDRYQCEVVYVKSHSDLFHYIAEHEPIPLQPRKEK